MRKHFLFHKPQIESPIKKQAGLVYITTNERNKSSNSVIRQLLRVKGASQLWNKKSPVGQGPKNYKKSNDSFQDILFVFIILLLEGANMRAPTRDLTLSISLVCRQLLQPYVKNQAEKLLQLISPMVLIRPRDKFDYLLYIKSIDKNAYNYIVMLVIGIDKP